MSTTVVIQERRPTVTIDQATAPVIVTKLSGGIKGDKGDKGDTGAGVPVGGTTGQVLSKVDGTDYNTTWSTPASALVSSVNGKTGTVVLNAADVGAATSTHNHNGIYQPVGTYSTDIHTNITALDNVSGVNTGDQDLSGYSPITHNHAGVYEPANANIQSHIAATDANPHGTNWDQLELTINKLPMNINPTTVPTTEGTLSWSATDHTLNIQSEITDSVLQVGQENWIRVINKTGSTIINGAAVYISGAQGNRPTANLAQGNAEATSYIIGVATAPIANNTEGYVTTLGLVRGFNTTSFTEGDTLYLSPTVAGGLTAIKPSAPNHAVIVGTALNSTINGSIFVNPSIGFELSELHDVLITTPANNSSLIYNTSTSLWEDKVLTYSDVGAPPSIHATQHLSSGSDPVNMHSFHGVLSRTTTSPLPTNITTTTFTLACATTPMTYYMDGVKVIVSTDKTTVLSGAAGFYYIYWDDTIGTLTNSTVFPGLYPSSTNVLIASVWWNGVDYGLVNDERHSYDRDQAWHTWAHRSVGTSWSSGLDLLTLTGTGAAATMTLGAGEILDEDITFTIPASASFATPNAYRYIYQTGASTYAFVSALSTVPFYRGVNNRPNVVNSTGYVLTELGSSPTRYTNFFVYATTDTLCPIYIAAETMSNATITAGGYTSTANARAVPWPRLTGIAVSAEMKPLYRVIVRADGVVQTFTAADDYRSVSSLPQSAGTSSTTASSVSFAPSGNVASTTVQQAIEELDSEKQAVAGVQSLGTQNTNYTVDFNSGRFVTVTTGSGNATLTIPDWTSSTQSVKAWLYITQGATARTQTLGAASGTNNNIISSGGLMSAGDALPNSGASTVDAFEFTWTGAKWFVSNALFDVKA